MCLFLSLVLIFEFLAKKIGFFRRENLLGLHQLLVENQDSVDRVALVGGIPTACAILVSISLTCSEKFDLSSVITPKYLTFVVLRIELFGHVISSLGVVKVSFGLMINTLDLAEFNVCLLANIRALTLFSSVFNLASVSLMVGALTIKQVSSANNLVAQSLLSGRSLI